MVLSERCYWTRQQLETDSPSRRDGMTAKVEDRYRRGYCQLITKAGLRLGVAHATTVAAMDFCHRFYAVRSMARNERFYVATAGLFLAGKVMETPKPLKLVLQTCWELHRPDEKEQLQDERFVADLREQVLYAERLMLYTVNFRFVHDADIPHKLLPGILARHELETAVQTTSAIPVLQVAWNFVNDSLQTTLTLQYTPHLIAVGAVFLTLQLGKLAPQPECSGRAWWEAEGATPDQIEDMVEQLMGMYVELKRQPPLADERTPRVEAVLPQGKAGGPLPLPEGGGAAVAAAGGGAGAGGDGLGMANGGAGGASAGGGRPAGGTASAGGQAPPHSAADGEQEGGSGLGRSAGGRVVGGKCKTPPPGDGREAQAPPGKQLHAAVG